ncbi:DUF3147 family protein [uncultured Ilyobacter sp.]|uniref:DUF3147 family protein n=1 Tax=uncultured Ilyobacter sp. TaxID=544433 RepID=UPI002AA92383|nr:DUF3147 family protein [uncultured Ilyobacter sp.]
MAYYITKFMITAILIVIISEVAERSSFIGAVLASIPTTSVIALIWIYADTKDVTKISNLSKSIFWLVLPSLALFVTLPLLLKRGINFYLSITISIGVTAGCYWLMVNILTFFKIKL